MHPSRIGKCLGIESLSWTHQVNVVAVKLTRPNVFLHKIRNYVNENTVSSIYFAAFDSYTESVRNNTLVKYSVKGTLMQI